MKYKIIVIISFLIIPALYIFIIKNLLGDNELKILIIGIDGADWEMVEPMVGEGLLPNFEKLIRHGASAKIDMNETGGSAVYWTSIATGQSSDKHGIKFFTAKDSQTGQTIPSTSNMRKTKAFWNILSEKNISVGIVGWYVTWPAENVNGFMVSSYYAVRAVEQPTWKGTYYNNVPDMTYPQELKIRIEKLIPTAQKSFQKNIKNIIKPSTLNIKAPNVIDAKWVLLTDEIYKEIGIELYKDHLPRVFAVYFSGLDSIGHRFTSPEKKISDLSILVYGDAHKNYYLYMDKVLGEFIELADDNTIIMALSDHGMMRQAHTQNEVFIMSGPKIKQNTFIKQPVKLTDICPTLLYLLNLPVAEDMDGRVFEEAIRDEDLKKNKILYVNSYGERKIEDAAPKRSVFDQEIKKRLKALGYLN